jgi:hypothetical protein
MSKNFAGQAPIQYLKILNRKKIIIQYKLKLHYKCIQNYKQFIKHTLFFTSVNVDA